jgi:eukaryotic-like serine/threonine-protein kinase
MQPDDLTGRTLSRYRILRTLGSGGMGAVYLAQDTQLERTVALKILPAEVSSDEERMRRFVREAKAASAIDHPNIVHVYEIGAADGVNFIAMQYVEGQTLSEQIQGKPLPTDKLLSAAIQITDVLAEAHAHGIIHRDLKPANIMMTAKEMVKLLDFGLARIEQPWKSEEGSQTPTQTKSEPGVVIGTVAYMSPEQSLGKQVDHRTDLFSLGDILYEMATGRQPFSGANPIEVIDKIVHAQPESVSRLNYAVPPELERIIRKCMEKDPDRRYQNASEILIDLKNLKRDLDSSDHPERLSLPQGRASLSRPYLRYGIPITLAILIIAVAAVVMIRQRSSTASPIHALAVLPFKNVNVDPKSEYLSDGITDSIINDLSRLTQLRVMARGTVFTYKNKDVDPREIGKQLQVDGVVSGRLLQQGDSLEITVDFVDARDGRQIWGEQYKRSTADLLSLQSQISKEISENLRLQLTGNEQKLISRQSTDNAEAYQLFLKGQYFLYKRTVYGTLNAKGLFEQAIEKDPNFALAYVGLANCYTFLGISGALLGGLPPHEVMPKGKEYALKALELDDTLGLAHNTLATIQFNYDWDWKETKKEYDKAMELNPNDPRILINTAFYFILIDSNNERAIQLLNRTMYVDPSPTPGSLFPIGIGYYWMHDYDTSLRYFQRIIEMEPKFPVANFWMGLDYLEKKDYKNGMERLQVAVDASARAPVALIGLGIGYAREGKAQEAEKILAELIEQSKKSYVPAFYVACLLANMGRADDAFLWLDKAYEERGNGIPLLKVLPLLDPIRSDARFHELLVRVNLS